MISEDFIQNLCGRVVREYKFLDAFVNLSFIWRLTKAVVLFYNTVNVYLFKKNKEVLCNAYN